MKKIRVTISDITKDKAVLKYQAGGFELPGDLMGEYQSGDSLVITVATEAEDKMKSNEVAQALLADVLKGE